MKKLLSIVAVTCGALVLVLLQAADRVHAQRANKPCYAAKARVGARVYKTPDPDFDPVLGYSRSAGPIMGAPAVDANGIALPVKCMAAPHSAGKGTTPKFYCTPSDGGDSVVYKIKPQFKGSERDKRNGEIYGEFLSSRFSKAVGFFADNEWVADVTCPDCEKSLNKPFQGAKFNPFQPAAGIEIPIGESLEIDCKPETETAELGDTLSRLDEVASASEKDSTHAEIDSFKLWLAFIDHGDTKKDNHRFACLSHHENGSENVCDEPIFYVSDMGSTFGFAKSSENKARLDTWRKKDPIRVNDGRCYANAKDVGDTQVSEEGRALLAQNLQRLLDAESRDQTITRVFAASRNGERDQPPAAWTAEFKRKAMMIINAKCSR